MNQTEELSKYAFYLFQRELSNGTIKIYVRQASLLLKYLEERQITKEEILKYKTCLQKKQLKAVTRNLHIVAVNSYLKYAGYEECTVRTERLQKTRSVSNVLSLEEYRRLLICAEESGRKKYYYLIKVLAQTGMRISELPFLTVEVLPGGKFMVVNKGKSREIYLSDKIIAGLSAYCQEAGIVTGSIFLNRQDRPLGRTAVNKMLRILAKQAGISKEKAHPHSLRHRFALTYMEQYTNLTELADLLGHTSLETTRINTVATAEEKRGRLNKLDL